MCVGVRCWCGFRCVDVGAQGLQEAHAGGRWLCCVGGWWGVGGWPGCILMGCNEQVGWIQVDAAHKVHGSWQQLMSCLLPACLPPAC